MKNILLSAGSLCGTVEKRMRESLTFARPSPYKAFALPISERNEQRRSLTQNMYIPLSPRVIMTRGEEELIEYIRQDIHHCPVLD
ncbi:MAG: transposase [Bacteroides sp.]|nr:transposase [Bacteroides sp.]